MIQSELQLKNELNLWRIILIGHVVYMFDYQYYSDRKMCFYTLIGHDWTWIEFDQDCYIAST